MPRELTRDPDAPLTIEDSDAETTYPLWRDVLRRGASCPRLEDPSGTFHLAARTTDGRLVRRGPVLPRALPVAGGGRAVAAARHGDRSGRPRLRRRPCAGRRGPGPGRPPRRGSRRCDARVGRRPGSTSGWVRGGHRAVRQARGRPAPGHGRRLPGARGRRPPVCSESHLRGRRPQKCWSADSLQTTERALDDRQQGGGTVTRASRRRGWPPPLVGGGGLGLAGGALVALLKEEARAARRKVRRAPPRPTPHRATASTAGAAASRSSSPSSATPARSVSGSARRETPGALHRRRVDRAGRASCAAGPRRRHRRGVPWLDEQVDRRCSSTRTSR